MIIRDIAIAFGVQVDEKSMNAAESSIKNLKGMATKMLGAIGIGFSLVQINAISEEFAYINTQIKQATNGLGTQKDIQQKILNAANDMKASYAATADIVSNLVQESPDLFGSVDEAIEYATLTTKLFKTAGKSKEEIAGLQEAINKSFAKGIVDTETINQLYERSPEAINLIAKSLGVAKESILDMASKGTLSLETLKTAFTQNADSINSDFGNVRFTITDAITNIRNQWGLYIDGLNDSVGVTQTIARFMVRGFGQVLEVLKKVQTFTERAADKFGGMGNLIKLVAATAGIIYAAMKAEMIMKFLTGVITSLKAIKLSTLTTVLAFIGLFLLIEDFIAFLQGKDSVIGKVLQNIGVDTDKVRDSFKWLGDMAGNAVKWITGNLDKLIPILYGLAVALAVIKTATTAWSIAQAALNLIMSMNPVMLVVMAIMALIGAFVLLWNKSEGFRNFWIGLWDGIKSIAAAVANWFSNAWDTSINAVISIFQGFYNTVMSIMQPILNIIDKVKNGVSGAIDKVKGWFGIEGKSSIPEAAAQLSKGATAATTNYAAGGVSNRSLSQTNNITNNFSGGDATAQKAGAKAMSKSANDATGYLARGLAYAR